MALLEVRDLHTSFVFPHRESLAVVDGVSFAVEAGETLGIVGESGCGKSMLALSLIRLLPRAARTESGSIVLSGVDLLRLRERQLDSVRGREIGVVFQDPMSSLNPTRQVGIQVAEVLTRHTKVSRKAALARTVELLDEVKIPKAAERIHAYPHELSGGMCQRVTIAMAIACAPKLIIADEPTTALDATIESQVLTLLEELQAAHHLAMILISHDMRVVARVADRVAVMYAGEFVEEAAADELFSNPQHPYTEALLESVPRVDDPDARTARLRTIPGAPPRLGQWAPACRFAPRCAYAGNDECAVRHPVLREVAPGHWARTAHPRSARGRAAAVSGG
jgi:oligopeptide/dipeptide ABC transporter ATP-binding protein